MSRRLLLLSELPDATSDSAPPNPDTQSSTNTMASSDGALKLMYFNAKGVVETARFCLARPFTSYSE